MDGIQFQNAMIYHGSRYKKEWVTLKVWQVSSKLSLAFHWSQVFHVHNYIASGRNHTTQLWQYSNQSVDHFRISLSWHCPLKHWLVHILLASFILLSLSPSYPIPSAHLFIFCDSDTKIFLYIISSNQYWKTGTLTPGKLYHLGEYNSCVRLCVLEQEQECSELAEHAQSVYATC